MFHNSSLCLLKAWQGRHDRGTPVLFGVCSVKIRKSHHQSIYFLQHFWAVGWGAGEGRIMHETERLKEVHKPKHINLSRKIIIIMIKESKYTL